MLAEMHEVFGTSEKAVRRVGNLLKLMVSRVRRKNKRLMISPMK